MSSTKASRINQGLLHATISTSVSSATSGNSTSKVRTPVRGPRSSKYPKRPNRHQMMQASPPRPEPTGDQDPRALQLGPAPEGPKQANLSPGPGLRPHWTALQHGITGAPHPDMGADPGGPASLHQVSTAQQPPALLQKWGRLNHPGRATARSPTPGRAPQARGRSDLSRGGCGPKRPPKVPPRKHSPLAQLLRGTKAFLQPPAEVRGSPHGWTGIRGRPASSPARSAPLSRVTPAAETRRQAATT
ncbi:hypothetical protein NDU88_000145 [Pleurodeles waltl]|uniref:Uncharacterized protein n=1 Tax=Pleurodeles waltl TaxID=8319 RepID=A0AAV7TET9_PLEWA|nr:hypothetical protein NDU88_000145 [Pleurodeles waltl]